MPTLLSVNNYYYARGGAEIVFLEHNAIFEDAGWDVACFSMKHPDNLPSKWSKYFINEIEFGENYSLAEKLLRVPKVIYSIEARRKMRRLLRDIPVDVCHMHNIYHHISPSILGVLREKEVPAVLTLHDLKIACPEYHMLSTDGVCERCKGGKTINVLLHRCIKNSYPLSGIIFLESLVHKLMKSYQNNVSQFIVPSRFYLKKLVEWGWDETQFTYIPNFIDSQLFTPHFKAGDEFVYFGRLSKEKGVSTLIRAAAKTNIKLRIIGGGPDELLLKQLASDLNANVEFTGYLTGDALHEAIRSSRAVVLPSEWYENAPLSILESYALGKPIIAASIGGIPELIREAETGIIFESGSVDGLADALSDFQARSSSSLVEMGRTGREWVENDFSKKRYRESSLSLYRKLGVSC